MHPVIGLKGPLGVDPGKVGGGGRRRSCGGGPAASRRRAGGGTTGGVEMRLGLGVEPCAGADRPGGGRGVARGRVGACWAAGSAWLWTGLHCWS